MRKSLHPSRQSIPLSQCRSYQKQSTWSNQQNKQCALAPLRSFIMGSPYEQDHEPKGPYDLLVRSMEDQETYATPLMPARRHQTRSLSYTKSLPACGHPQVIGHRSARCTTKVRSRSTWSARSGHLTLASGLAYILPSI